MHCLFATLGKDTPGVNAIVRAGTRMAIRREFSVYGARRGFPGILSGKFWKLGESDVAGILGRGGCCLGSSDFFVSPNDSTKLDALAKSFKRFDLVVATGGFGSFSVLDRLYEERDMGLTTTIFIPTSVENEFLDPRGGSEAARGPNAESVGADTAVNTALRAIDSLREQSYLSNTVFVIQCVGLKSNFLPIQVGLGCGAHRIYLPPFPQLSAAERSDLKPLFGEDFDPTTLNMREFVRWAEQMFREKSRTYLIAVIPNGVPLFERELGGAANASERRTLEPENPYEQMVTAMAPVEMTVLRMVDELNIHFSNPDGIQIRYLVVDDLQRGGDPSHHDRALGSLYGQAAIEEFLNIIRAQEVEKRGNLNLLAVEGVNTAAWKCHTRQEVMPHYRGTQPRAGGLDALPFFRLSRGTVSGYRPLATV